MIARGLSGAVREFNENSIASVADARLRRGAVFQLAAIDMARETAAALEAHRAEQATKMTEALTERHPRMLARQLQELSAELRALTSQLYIQAVCTWTLLYDVIQKTTLYYAQRAPRELAEFRSCIDAKNVDKTAFEKLWETILLPILQSQAIGRPFIVLADAADYSYFDAYCGERSEPPEHLRSVASGRTPFRYVDVKALVKKHFRFEQSHADIGLQLADIVTTTSRRAMNGRLRSDGWSDLGKLFIQSERGEQTVLLLSLTQGGYCSHRLDPTVP
jgi:hypothetical protein